MIGEIKKTSGPSISWARFIKKENIASIAPLLYNDISQSGSENSVSPRLLQYLKNIYNDTLAYNIILAGELKNILRLAGETGIDIILLKGAALIAQVYKNPALRPMTDIDILVCPLQFPAVKKLLNDIGYEDVSRGPEDFVKYVGGKLIDIDVHTGLINLTRIPSRAAGLRLDYDSLKQGASRIEFDGESVFILSPEDCLIDLSVHLVLHHGMDGLLWFLDVFYFLGSGTQINWDVVVRRARECGADKFLYLTLYYVKEKFGANTPVDAIERLKVPLGFMEKKVFADLLNGRAHSYSKFVFSINAAGSMAEKMSLLRQLLLPSLSVLEGKYRRRGFLPLYFAHFKNIIRGLAS